VSTYANDKPSLEDNSCLWHCPSGEITTTLLEEWPTTYTFSSNKYNVTYVATSGKKLYYTGYYTHAVTCCDLHGTTQWEFKDERVLRGPRGISVDNDGNVYVVGHSSNNVVVISPNEIGEIDDINKLHLFL
jgi:DNA-binding beta-propeller fold protein YncE